MRVRPRAPEGAGDRRSAGLAAVLGGRVLKTAGGPLVAVESAVRLPLDVERLACLPFAVPQDAPLVCLDLETTGLGTGAGTLAFLVGLGVWEGEDFRVTQLLLPDHADEARFLDGLAELIPAGAWLVTYNGRSFDWPLLVARFRLHRRDPPPTGGHLDLLPVARQLWRHRLADARLSTVEHGLCGVEREHDLPGALVPERYFGYLRERRAELLVDVVEHNRQDIVSLGLLLQVLAGRFSPAGYGQAAHPGDLAGLARAYARRRRHADALACLDAALASELWSRGVVGGAGLRRKLATERALTLGRLGRPADALAAWHQLAESGGPGAGLAWIRIASHREWFERDHEGALAACRKAADVCARARSWGRPLHGVERDLSRRLPRLQRRVRGSLHRVRRDRRAVA